MASVQEEESDVLQPDDDAEAPRAEYLRRKLRLALIRAREAKGMPQKELATKLGWSVSKVSRIEQGTNSVAPSDARAMFSLFGATESVIQEHVQLALDAREARSWADFADVISAEYMEYIGQEQSATHIYKYETGLIPGLLQLPEYSRELFHELDVEEKIAKRRAELRQLRQQILDDPKGSDVMMVVGEVALVRVIGGQKVMKAQIDHLITMSDHPRISLYLMPFTAGGHPGMGTPFTILEFRDEKVPSALFLEDGRKRTTSIDDATQVERHRDLFNRIVDKAEQSGTFQSHAARILNQYYQDPT